jgi:photosystem II stability/assembly factor-like uncharacterized protein
MMRIVRLWPLLLLASVLQAQNINEALYKNMKWRLVGPFRGGRALAVAGIPDNPSTYYFGAVSGGVWKTTDAGSSWQAIFDNQPISSIGAIAVAESDPNVIYVGTGEACIRGNISYGDGVYKSTDAGKTWKHIGLTDTRQIGRVIAHPRNADVVFVAALGHAYGTSTERGIFRSINGGKSWEKVLYKDDKTGGIDLSFDPGNPDIIFATLWEANRSPWGMTSGGPGSGLYQSTDAGTTWKRLEGGGLPRGILGRIGVSVSGANSDRVYALIEAADGGLFRSDDGGKAWRRVSDDHRITQRAWYYMHVFADPKNVDTVYVLNTGLLKSQDGGRTWTQLRAPHGDHHGLWIDPHNPERMINANDGGATVTADGGRTWSTVDNQPTAQFYHIAADNRYPYYLYGAQQDNSTVAIATRGSAGGIGPTDWYPVGGGESGFVVPYPKDPNIVYAGSYGNMISRFDKSTGQIQQITAWPDNPMGWAAADLKYRFQWTAPIVISPHDPDTLYHAAQVLFKSTNGGMSWTAISPDLTRNDKSKQQSSGGPITKDNTSVEYYDVIFAVAESPVQKDLIWAGSDDGLVNVTRDGGAHWGDVTPSAMPEWGMVSLIEASPHDAGTAYISVDRHRMDDFRPYIFKTADFGKTWTKIVAGIPENHFVHAVREDPKRRGLLYAGTESGVLISFDDGARWQSLQLNLPTTPVHDLVVHNDDLAIATHGRSFWVLDDITPLRQMNDGIATEDLHVFTPGPAYRTRGGGFGGGGGRPGGAVGQNPPTGVIINYYLKTAAASAEPDSGTVTGGRPPRSSISLDILDAAGKVLRHLPERQQPRPEGAQAEAPPEEEFFRGGPPARIPAEAGFNRFVWDMRTEPATRVPGAILWAGQIIGPIIPPGKYQARLTVNGKSQTIPFELHADPRIHIPQADFEKQFDLAVKIRERLTQVDDTVNRIRDYRSQLQALRRRLAQNPQGRPVVTAADELDKKMTAVEEELLQVKSKAAEDPLNYPIKLNNKLAALANVVESADSAPPQQCYDVFNELDKQAGEQLAKWNDIVAKDVPAFNDTVRKADIPALPAK